MLRRGGAGEDRDYLELSFAGGDRIFVPVEQIGRVTRYSGGERPALSKLGGTEWLRAKQRVRKAVDDLAEELLALYASRANAQGHAFGPDTPWQSEMEASFPYEETIDQLRAAAEVKADMELTRPMDRLVVGDVGYGKTEVALRAAFKAVQDGKQVAVLVPTTVLAAQHDATFSQRFAAFPIEVRLLSRFVSATAQAATLDGLADGTVDIVIGTHRLLSKDVRFKDLGLVVVDEEQRFGVAAKERLKQLKREVDVLTLSATPIPRTLNLALAGIRDLSVIETPPEDRLPIQTRVAEASAGLVRDAILRELDRGGQVFYVHNRVETIEAQAEQLRQMLPGVRFVVGHGQMGELKNGDLRTRFPNYDATIVPFEEGDVVSGKVVQIDQDEVLVDIGYKSEGVIPLSELSIRKSVDPHDEVDLGEEVDALVLTKEDQDGRLLLSKKRARFEKAWRKIEAAAESGEPVEGTVIEVVKGGLIIDLGVRGFLPASLVDIRRVQNLDEFLGTKIECKVIELNRSRNNVVLSRRAVLEEERKEVRQQILDRLQPGMIVEGAISNIVDFGAFVDLDGIDGLIHISELSWSHVNHPSEILAIGDVVPVKVLDIDRDRQRISLGLKQTQEDPWQRVIDTYRVGDELEGKVTKVVTFGAFVEIMEGVEGLVHISELAHHHVENPREILEPGQDVRVKILEIDSERRRLSLSVKRVAEQLPHIKSAAAAGAAAAGVSEEIGDVPDLGLSEDVFAGPQVSGVDDLRAAVADFVPPEEAEEAPPLPEPAAAAEPRPRLSRGRRGARGRR